MSSDGKRKATGSPKAAKINPRNLTARASYVVRGNPVISRPEDSVGNTIPGLEFDDRNLENFFFPGLVFEFQRAVDDVDEHRPLLRDVFGAGPATDAGLTAADVTYSELPRGRQVHLWALRGGDGREFNFHAGDIDSAGFRLGAWRAIRDLKQGPCKILLATLDARRSQQVFASAVAAFASATASLVQRGPGGALSWAILVGETLPMLDEDGVINRAIPQGELQSTMCTPWQYDFRDCKCYYWAANRPDLVAAADGSDEMAKFLRKDRSLPTIHTAVHQDWLDQNGQSHVDTLNGWEDIPVIINDREVSYAARLVSDVRGRLKTLATVEHALAVEYLFAYYSLNTSKPGVAAAAADLLTIAVEEMKHFRWVNEILGVLGENPVIGRAANYGPGFANRSFALEPFTADKLRWFTQIERPSRTINMPGQIDGMYVRLLDIVERNPGEFPNSDDIKRLLKLIIDEGETHYRLFMAIREGLSGYASHTEFLIAPSSQAPNATVNALLNMSDAAYASLLAQLSVTFHMQRHSTGVDLQRSVRSMHTMDALNKQLAGMGFFPRFTLSAGMINKTSFVPAEMLAEADRCIADMKRSVRALAGSGTAVQSCANAAIEAHSVAVAQLRQELARMEAAPSISTRPTTNSASATGAGVLPTRQSPETVRTAIPALPPSNPPVETSFPASSKRQEMRYPARTPTATPAPLATLHECSLDDAMSELHKRACAAPGTLPHGHDPRLASFTSRELHAHAKAQQKVIYGSDNRVDIFEVADPLIRLQADAVAGIIDPSRIRDNGNGTSHLLTVPFRVSHHLCSNERFAEQPVAPDCTAFLVAHDIVVTAGHCINNGNLPMRRFVFGFQMTTTGARLTISNNDIYRARGLIAHHLDGELDYAVVRLDRPVLDRTPLKVRRTGRIADNADVYVIGHPAGLPAKYAPGAAVRSNANASFFTANLDTYGGNSGSPVFNQATGEVEGILVRGETDFVMVDNCFVSNVCPTTGCRGEDVTRATTFAEFVPDAANGTSMEERVAMLERTMREMASHMQCLMPPTG